MKLINCKLLNRMYIKARNSMKTRSAVVYIYWETYIKNKETIYIILLIFIKVQYTVVYQSHTIFKALFIQWMCHVPHNSAYSLCLHYWYCENWASVRLLMNKVSIDMNHLFLHVYLGFPQTQHVFIACRYCFK